MININIYDAIIPQLWGETIGVVIPASEARRESCLKKDSGQAGMTPVTEWLHDAIYFLSYRLLIMR